MGHCSIGRLVFLAVLVAPELTLGACNSSAADPPPDHGAVATAAIERGTLLQDTFTAYPRLVRLAHQADPARNGRIVASVTQTVGGVPMAGIHASDDDGASFAPLGAVVDDAFATGLCCGSLFELPQAVGALPAGTLLYAAAVGGFAVGAAMTIPIDRSDDGGGPWEMVAAPIGVPSAPSVTNWCQNYSTALLADASGGLLMMQTDGGPDASCRARHGRTTFGADASSARHLQMH